MHNSEYGNVFVCEVKTMVKLSKSCKYWKAIIYKLFYKIIQVYVHCTFFFWLLQNPIVVRDTVLISMNLSLSLLLTLQLLQSGHLPVTWRLFQYNYTKQNRSTQNRTYKNKKWLWSIGNNLANVPIAEVLDFQNIFLWCVLGE